MMSLTVGIGTVLKEKPFVDKKGCYGSVAVTVIGDVNFSGRCQRKPYLIS
jgi:hypothetical protein